MFVSFPPWLPLPASLSCPMPGLSSSSETSRGARTEAVKGSPSSSPHYSGRLPRTAHQKKSVGQISSQGSRKSFFFSFPFLEAKTQWSYILGGKKLQISKMGGWQGRDASFPSNRLGKWSNFFPDLDRRKLDHFRLSPMQTFESSSQISFKYSTKAPNCLRHAWQNSTANLPTEPASISFKNPLFFIQCLFITSGVILMPSLCTGLRTISAANCYLPNQSVCFLAMASSV